MTVTEVTSNDQCFGALTGNIHGYQCPRCYGSWGYIFMDVTGAMYFCGEKECLKDDSRASLAIKHSQEKPKERDAAREFGIGSNYRNASFANWLVPADMQQSTIEWVKKPYKFLIYQGVPGAGKTYFCAAVANYLFSLDRNPRYIHTRTFLENCKKAFEPSSSSPEEYTRKISSCEILIIDDLGSTMNTEFQKEMLLGLIDRRYSFNAPTIITTNLARQTMEECLGERIARRVFSESKIITKDKVYGN